MMRSMFSGVSGLRVHQTKMDVIANNIANVNTAGYKSSRITFNEVFSQTLSGASGANPDVGRGGTNAMQIGLGVNVASIDMLMTPGAAQRTDNPYDLMIQGEGFFVVSDASGTYFTRAGAFRLDNFGNLTTPQGMMLNGWKAEAGNVPGTTVIQKTGVKPIQITGNDEIMNPARTTLIDFKGNLNGLDEFPKETTMSVFDSLGNKYVIDVRMQYDKTAKDWSYSIGNYMYPEGDKSKGIYIGDTPTAASGGTNPLSGAAPYNATITTTAQTTPPAAFKFNEIGKFKFDTFGYPDLTVMTGIEFTFDDAAGALSPESAFGEPVVITLTGLKQFSGTSDATSETRDGNKPGTLTGVSIGSDGVITGRYSNGKTKDLWQIALAQFKNPAGLERKGSNLYVSTTNSGSFDGVGVPPGEGATLLAGVLEMANVDLAAEFTEMITAQRGFQANSRVITTSDDMLQELVNLKR